MAKTCLQNICVGIVKVHIRLCTEDYKRWARYIDESLVAELGVVDVVQLSLVVKTRQDSIIIVWGGMENLHINVHCAEEWLQHSVLEAKSAIE